jgi:tetratricopeptide (TPR) repeat protein
LKHRPWSRFNDALPGLARPYLLKYGLSNSRCPMLDAKSPMLNATTIRHLAALAGLLLLAGQAMHVFAQQAPPPEPGLGKAAAPPTPGLSANLAEARKLIRDRQFAPAMAKIDTVLLTDPKNPQARFMKGVVQTEQNRPADAIETFQKLIEDFPELPEPYNNLAVIFAQKGQYEQAKSALELALKSNPDYAIAHENLADVYARLAGVEYERAAALDKSNKNAKAKLALVRELYAAPMPTPAPSPAETGQPGK